MGIVLPKEYVVITEEMVHLNGGGKYWFNKSGDVSKVAQLATIAATNGLYSIDGRRNVYVFG